MTNIVAIIMNKDCAKSLILWEPINEELASILSMTTIIQCYTPTNDAEDKAKDAYYEALHHRSAKHRSTMFS